MNRSWTTGVLTLVALVAGSAVGAEAQRPRGGGPGMGPEGPARGLEMVLEHAEELELTAEQVEHIEEIRDEARETVSPIVEEMRGLREKVRAGEVERSEARERMTEFRDRMREAMEPFHGSLVEVLTDEQHDRFQQIMRDARRGPPRKGRRGGGGG